jgi:hypothetical protein
VVGIGSGLGSVSTTGTAMSGTGDRVKKAWGQVVEQAITRAQALVWTRGKLLLSA